MEEREEGIIFFTALSRPYVISVSFLVGRAVVELLEVLRALYCLFSRPSDFPLLSLLLIARAQPQRHFPNQNRLSQIYERRNIEGPQQVT